MTQFQKNCGEHVRWAVIEVYFGNFESRRFICACETFDDARLLIDCLVNHHKGRPYRFFVRPLVNDEDVCDWEISGSDPIDGTPYDYSEYLQGIYC